MSLVSVIIPTYNRPHLTLRAVQSVLQQSYKDYELIVIDDGSSDDSLQTLLQNLRGLKLDLYQKANAGVSSTRNFGAALSKGKWLAFLDSDDEWLPNKLERQIQHTQENPNHKIVHTEELWIRNDKQVPVHPKYTKQSGNLFEAATKRCAIGPSTVLIDSDLFNEHKGFDESYPACEDFEFWLRLTHAHTVGLITEPLIKKYAGHDDQLSSQPELDYWRALALYKALLDLDLSKIQRQQVVSSLKEKLMILIAGYEKFNHPNKLKWAKDLLSEVEFEFDY